MSGLNLSFDNDQDLIDSTGEFLPAIYINQIRVYQNHDAEDGKQCLYEVDGYILATGIENTAITYSVEDLISSISSVKYYILSVTGITEDYKNDLLSGKIDVIRFCYEHFKNNAYEETNENIDARLYNIPQIDVEDYEKIVNVDGKFAVAFKKTITATEIDGEEGFLNGNVENILCFSTTFDFQKLLEEDKIGDFLYGDFLYDEVDDNTVLKTFHSDVSYEPVYLSSGTNELAITEKYEFFDSSEKSYPYVPLATIQGSVHKKLNIDHDYIKNNIEDLLNDPEFQAPYTTEGEYKPLKNIMKAIYKTLELHGQDYDILPRLNDLKESFSIKVPIHPAGKLYKRYSKRLFLINQSVGQGEILYKKNVTNTKILDLRTRVGNIDLPDGTTRTSFRDSEIETYIYSDVNLFSNIGVVDNNRSVVSGYFFFDYEQVLRTRSVASKYIDVNKLENLGINIPYERFMITNVEITGDGGGIVGSVSESLYEEQKYPYVTYIQFDNEEIKESYAYYKTPHANASYAAEIANTFFYGSESSESSTDDGNLGFVTSVLNRSYTYAPNTAFNIEDYRLMLFEILEYRQRGNYDYGVDISILDNTAKVITDLLTKVREMLDSLGDYVDLVNEACAYNNSLNVFNRYFIDNLLEDFSNVNETPWYQAPILYVLCNDLLYDVYSGDRDTIEAAAKNIIINISPATGTKEGIDQFYSDMQSIVNDLVLIELDILATQGIDPLDILARQAIDPVTIRFVKPNVDVPNSQEKIFSATSTSDVEVLATKTTTKFINKWPRNSGISANFIDLYGDDADNWLAELDIEGIVSIRFGPYTSSATTGTTTEAPSDVSPDYTENDGRKGRYTLGTSSELLYEYDLDEGYFIIYNLGYWEIEYY